MAPKKKSVALAASSAPFTYPLVWNPAVDIDDEAGEASRKAQQSRMHPLYDEPVNHKLKPPLNSPDSLPPKYTFPSDAWMYHVGDLKDEKRGEFWPANFEKKNRPLKSDVGYGAPATMLQDGKRYYVVAFGKVQLYGEEGHLKNLRRYVGDKISAEIAIQAILAKSPVDLTVDEIGVLTASKTKEAQMKLEQPSTPQSPTPKDPSDGKGSGASAKRLSLGLSRPAKRIKAENAELDAADDIKSLKLQIGVKNWMLHSFGTLLEAVLPNMAAVMSVIDDISDKIPDIDFNEASRYQSLISVATNKFETDTKLKITPMEYEDEAVLEPAPELLESIKQLKGALPSK